MKRIISCGICLALLLTAFIIPGAAGTSAAISDSSGYVYDTVLGYIKGVDIGTTAASFRLNFTDDVKITSPDGAVLGDDDPVGTDYTVSAVDDMKILVYGDVNRDGGVNVKDVSMMLRRLAGTNVSPNEAAADVNLDGAFNVKDCAVMLKYFAGWNVVLGYQPLVYTEDAPVAAYEDITLSLYMVNSEKKYEQEDTAIDGTPNYHMYCAKNEIEFCQAYLVSLDKMEGLSAKLTDFTDKNGSVIESSLLWMDYMQMQTFDGWWPDILPPMADTFRLTEGKSQGLFIRCKVPEDAGAGLYRATLSVYDADGREIKKAYIFVTVWDFALPVETSCKTAFGLSDYDIYATHKLYSGDDWVLYSKYYDFMLENRICAYRPPYELTDSRVDAYLSDPRVNNFLVSGNYGGAKERTADELREIYAKISQNDEWMKKAMFYVTDEPSCEADILSMASQKEFIDSIWKDARILVPQHVDQIYEPGQSPVDFYKGEDMMYYTTKYSTVPCPSYRMFRDYGNLEGEEVWYLQYAKDKYGTLVDRMNSLRDEGRELWWYSTGFKISWTFDHVRSLFWSQYDYDFEGILYFLMNEWNSVMGKKAGPSTGLLVYPGSQYKVDGPIPCVRCEVVRDGIEDFEYLKMIEKAFGRETALEYCHRISTSVDVFPDDGRAINDVRVEMGELLQEYYRTVK